MMSDHCQIAPRLRPRVTGPLLGVALVIGAAGDLAALPPVGSPSPPSQAILVADPANASPQAAGADVAAAPFSELNDALAAARGRLEELSKAAEAVAATGEMRRDLAALQAENRQLTAEIQSLRAVRDAQQASDAQIGKLTRLAEAAAAKAQSLDEELVALRWQNAQLNTSLTQARNAREQAEAEAAQARGGEAVKIEQLNAALEQSTAEIARMRQEIDTRERSLVDANRARGEAEARLTEVQEQARHAEAARARFDDQSAAIKEQVRKAEQERDGALEHAASLRAETGQLRTRLAALEAELQGARLANDQLEMEMTAVRAAASSATEAARRNLAAVEDRIKQLNQALVAVEPAAGPADTAAPAAAPAAHGVAPTEAADGGTAADGGASAAEAWVAAINPPMATTAPSVTQPMPPPAAVVAPIPPPMAPSAAPIPAPVAPAAVTAPIARPPSSTGTQKGAAVDIGLIKSANAADSQANAPVGTAFADLSLEQRLHVQGLLANLDTQVDRRGLIMTVPGAALFTTNSDEVEPSAHDALAKVAELLSVYDDRRVLIVGHTDAIGEAGYNKQLSERRADLVKRFFVDNFAIEEARLTTQGRGEDQPIASNDTPRGRQTNRRVEVVILN